MKFELKKMHIKNFKGITDREINFGHRTFIYGRNAVGKTTVYDAMMWVLFGKMSNGTKPDRIRPHDEKGKDIDFIDISVEMDVEIDGKHHTIKKVQRQNWVKHHGEEKKVFEGNVNEWEVDGVPKTQTEFKKWMNLVIEEDVFMFTSSALFLKLPMKKKREQLFNLIGDMTDLDVIDKHPDLAGTEKLFDGCSIDDAIKRGKKEIATYNKMIAEIPARIDELNNQRTVVDVSDMELQKNALLEKIADLEKQREDLLSNSKEVEKIADRILELKFEKSDIEKKAADKLLAERKEFENAVYKAETEFADLLNRQRKSEQAINSTLSAIKQFELHKDLLAQQYKDVRSEQIGENAHICPTCGQNLPEESISEIEAKFAASKTERLAKISAEGMETKNIIDEDQKTVEDEKKRLEEIKSLKLKLEANKAKAMEQLNKLPEQIDLSDNQEYEKICAEIAKLEEAVNEKRNSDYTACLIKEISATRNELEYVNEHLAKADNSTIDDRIAELQEEQREIAQKIADSEKDVYMLEEFNRAKISMMTEKINGHFSLVTWKLFDMQQNGRYKEVCIPTFEGADYGNGLNTGHAIATEIDITATLQKINKVSVPVFLDNAESINAGNIPEIDCQLITLNVTEDDKEMRVEVEE